MVGMSDVNKSVNIIGTVVINLETAVRSVSSNVDGNVDSCVTSIALVPDSVRAVLRVITVAVIGLMLNTDAAATAAVDVVAGSVLNIRVAGVDVAFLVAVAIGIVVFHVVVGTFFNIGCTGVNVPDVIDVVLTVIRAVRVDVNVVTSSGIVSK